MNLIKMINNKYTEKYKTLALMRSFSRLIMVQMSFRILTVMKKWKKMKIVENNQTLYNSKIMREVKNPFLRGLPINNNKTT